MSSVISKHDQPCEKSKKRKAPDEYEVEDIVGLGGTECKSLYKIKWKGYSSSTNTWEPVENLIHSLDKVVSFYARIFEFNVNYTRNEDATQLYNEIKRTVMKTFQEDATKIESTFFIYPPEVSESNVTALLNVILKLEDEIKKDRLLKDVKTLIFFDVFNVRKNNLLRELLEWQKIINCIERSEIEIIAENLIDLDGPPKNFNYINYNLMLGVKIENNKEAVKGCNCEDNCLDYKNCCNYLAEDGCNRAYSKTGKVNVPFGTPIYECNSKCECSITCLNRVVQRGISVKLGIFRTNGRGWGLKTMQYTPKGSFICEYIGEVITSGEADERGKKYDKENKTYLFDIDFCDDQSLYTIDSAEYGNVSRFINHSCSPNLRVYCAYVDTKNLNLPHISFFANRDIRRGEELTFDYNSKLPKGENVAQDMKYVTQCLCSSENCRKYIF